MLSRRGVCAVRCGKPRRSKLPRADDAAAGGGKVADISTGPYKVAPEGSKGEADTFLFAEEVWIPKLSLALIRA